MKSKEANLLSHRISVMIQEYALPEYQGESGLEALLEQVNQALGQVESNITVASTSDFRKTYHVSWSSLLESVVEPSLREIVTDRFKKLVF